MLEGASAALPRKSWRVYAIVGAIVLIGVLGVAVRFLLNPDVEQVRRFAFQRFDTRGDHFATLRRLKTKNPAAYLSIIRKERGESAWFAELAKLAPAQYKQEQRRRADLQMRIAATQERAAAEDKQATFDGTGCKVSLNQFYALQTGMRYSTAHKLLGCNGTEMSRVSLGGYNTIMYAWKGDGMLGANMNAEFQNGRLIAKAQFGLQ